jgi:hypothetical protein
MKNHFAVKYIFSIGVALFFFILNTGNARANSFYVSPSGSDIEGNGSLIQPWQSLSYACANVHQPGDVIRLSEGTFNELNQCQLARGVSIEGSDTGKTTLSSEIDDWLIVMHSKSHTDGNQSLSNFTLNGLNRRLKGGIYAIGRSNIKIFNVNFEEIRITGCQIIATEAADKTNPPQFFIRGIEVHNCTFRNCSADFSGWSSGCLQIGHLMEGKIFRIAIHEDTGYGIKYWAGGWFKSVSIFDCGINVPSFDSNWGADIAIELWNLSDDCEIYRNTTNNWISLVYGNRGGGNQSVRAYNNTILFERTDNPKEAFEIGSLSDAEIFSNYAFNAKRGVAIWDVGGGPSNNTIVRNNVFCCASKGDGVLIHDGQNHKVVNNVFDQLSSGLAINARSGVSQTLFANNIVINSDFGVTTMGNGYVIRQLDIDNNVFYNVKKIYIDWGGATASTILRNSKQFPPELLFSGLRPDPYYRPIQPKSNVIDSGTDHGFPFKGVAPDLGAFEYNGEAPPQQNDAPKRPARPTNLRIIR